MTQGTQLHAERYWITALFLLQSALQARGTACFRQTKTLEQCVVGHPFGRLPLGTSKKLRCFERYESLFLRSRDASHSFVERCGGAEESHSMEQRRQHIANFTGITARVSFLTDGMDVSCRHHACLKTNFLMCFNFPFSYLSKKCKRLTAKCTIMHLCELPLA